MEYIVGIVLIILVVKFFVKNKHLFFIEDNPKPKFESDSHSLLNRPFKPTFSPTVNNFKLRPSLLNSNEHVFFNNLKLAVGDRYDIYPQISLGAIFQPVKQWNNWGDLSRLNKRIDFVLFDKNNQTPKIAIELDGDSHSKFKSFKRDEFVNDIFKKFNLHLIRFNNGNYSAEEIKNKLSLF